MDGATEGREGAWDAYDADSLAAPARRLRVLTTHTHAPVVPQAPVTPDLPQPIKVLAELEIQPVREHLRAGRGSRG